RQQYDDCVRSATAVTVADPAGFVVTAGGEVPVEAHRAHPGRETLVHGALVGHGTCDLLLPEDLIPVSERVLHAHVGVEPQHLAVVLRGAGQRASAAAAAAACTCSCHLVTLLELLP